MSRDGELDATAPSDPGAPSSGAESPLPASVSRFTVEAKLGAGAMGLVLLATDPVLGRRVALKLMRDAAASDEHHRRFLREAQAAAKIVHDNIIVIHEVGTHGEQVFVAMEYVAGTTLGRWQSGRPWRAIVETYVRAGRGLAAAHDAGLVHRDFKPDNVLIGDDGRVRVTDFGLVAAIDAAAVPAEDAATAATAPSGDLSASLTRTGAVMGTPRYMAPEQHRAQQVDARADQFAFCVALYEALFERGPFPGATYAELAAAVLHGEMVAPPATSEVPVELRAALVRGLASDREARFPSMHELLDVLREAAADPTPQPKSRRRPLAIAGVGVSLALAGALAWKVATPKPEAPARVETQPLPKSVKHARVEFDDAEDAFRRGDYDRALAGFSAAYQYEQAPQMIFNIAAVHHQRGRERHDPSELREAIRWYQRYVDAAPAEPDVARVKEQIAVIDAEAQGLEAQKKQ